MHKDTIFCGATSTLLLCTTHVIGFNRDLEIFFFQKGFSNFCPYNSVGNFFHVWEFTPQLNCSCLDIFFALHAWLDWHECNVHIHFHVEKKNENWEEERIFTQRFIKLPSPPVNCIEGKNLIIIVMKNARKLKNLSLLLRVFWYVSPRL